MDEPDVGNTRATPALDGDDLVIVSNRQPYSHNYEENAAGERVVSVDRPAGGLTAGLDPVLQETDGTWVAWSDGDADDAVTDDEGRVRVPDASGYTLKRLELSEDDVADYYYGYSNQVLWPLCHAHVETIAFEERFWQRYQDVNETFADAAVDAANEGDVVWFQDYHFALAPRQVRERRPETYLAQFWHIPWPSWDVFRLCPHGERLLDGLLANDLLGFHTERYCEQFVDCVDRALDDATVDRTTGSVEYDGDTTHVRAFPMGVDAAAIHDTSQSDDARAFWRTFEREHGLADVRVAVGVDRLDYTKGIVERLDALARLWETHPEWQGELTYVQKACESRSRIPAYQTLQAEVGERIEAINERFGTDDWQPVVYVEEFLPREALVGLYRGADLALVSPLRDGMNLVAKEYVASQVDDDGVLVLSDQTGAHEELGEYALSVNPLDTAGFTDAIAEALTMDDRERGERMHRLRGQVATRDLDRWMNAVFDAIAADRRADEATAYAEQVR